MDNGKIKRALRNIFSIYRDVAAFEAEYDAESQKKIIGAYETHLKHLWIAAAAIRSLEATNRRADLRYPGYLTIFGAGRDIHVPFHLVPSLPEDQVLTEAIELSKKICLAEKYSTICLSGSSLLLGDIGRIGDIDFCEYLPRFTTENEARAAVERLLVDNNSFHKLEEVLLRVTPDEPFQRFSYISADRFDSAHKALMEEIATLMTSSCNGKTLFYSTTKFAGTTEVTNWLVFYDGDFEEGGASAKLSFAAQEAVFGGAPIRGFHLVKTLVDYIKFLESDIIKYKDENPVKAAKRAIALLRLFGEEELLEELLLVARETRVFSFASALARIDLYESRARVPGLEAFCAAWKRESEALASEAAGKPLLYADVRDVIAAGMKNFSAKLETAPLGPIWLRILSIAAGA